MCTCFVTGDIHGEVDIKKLSAKNFNKDNELGLTKEDCMIICGDFGLVWNEGSAKRDKWWLNWLDEKPWTTLFVDGNHDGFAMLDSYPVDIWNGGKVHHINDSVIHLMRGQVFNLHGKSFFAMGGAASHDKEYRVPGRTWWAREIPSFCEREEALGNLEKHDWEVDYVITHEAPTNVMQRLLWYNYSYVPNEYTDWLQQIALQLKFKQWFFGHYHMNMELYDGKFHVLYGDIVKIDG